MRLHMHDPQRNAALYHHHRHVKPHVLACLPNTACDGFITWDDGEDARLIERRQYLHQAHWQTSSPSQFRWSPSPPDLRQSCFQNVESPWAEGNFSTLSRARCSYALDALSAPLDETVGPMVRSAGPPRALGLEFEVGIASMTGVVR
jgi:hypothetical protein